MKAVAVLLTLSVLATAVEAAEDVAVTGCSWLSAKSVRQNAATEGPYRHLSSRCIEGPDYSDYSSYYYVPSRSAISPDASGIAWSAINKPVALNIADIKSGTVVSTGNPTDKTVFDGRNDHASPAVWLTDSQSILAPTQQIETRYHSPLSGLSLVRVSRDAVVNKLPPLTSDAGPLDAIQWIGNDGIAIVEFGTRGDSYRPKRANNAPEMAFVNAISGKILDRLPLFSIISGREDRASFKVESISAFIAPDGRPHALITVFHYGERTRIFWRSGLPPKTMPGPSREIEIFSLTALVPPGKSFLDVHQLEPWGRWTSCPYAGPCPERPPPEPRTGTILVLRDEAGKAIWTHQAKVAEFGWYGGMMHVDDTGTFALMRYPGAYHERQLGVIRVADGTLVQTIPIGTNKTRVEDAGFFEGGKAIWTRVDNVVSIYRRD